MKRVTIAGICFLLSVAVSLADSYVRQPSVDVVRYDIAVELSDTADSITGDTKILVLMQNENVSGMWLDFAEMQVDHVRIDGNERLFEHKDGRLLFEFGRSYSKKELAMIEVQYHGRLANTGMILGKNRYNRRAIFTNNWPDNAHRWFPSIDHPYDKAAVTISVTAPERYDVVSNGEMIRTARLLDGKKLTQWSEHRNIPTYCIAFGAAEFAVAPPKDFAGIPLQSYAFPEDAKAAAGKFRNTASIIDFFQTLVGPYPYEKLAQVQSTIPLGGMENASAIFYNESLFQNNPVIDYPVPHEVAHQWFGDSVTIADWDHLWLSEGFATYFDALFYDHMYGRGRLKEIMEECAMRLKAYGAARSTAVIDSGETDLMKKLTPLNYDKGAWILHMLRGMLGDETFFKGIRRFYQLYADRNAESEDFQKVMESASGLSLNTFFHQWLYQPGWPEYVIAWRWDGTRHEVILNARQTQTAGLFDMSMDVIFYQQSGPQAHKFHIAGKEQEFRIPSPAKPLAVTIDPENWVLKSLALETR